MSADLRPPALARPLMDAAFLANPYPTYDALRQAGPIHWSEEFFGGAWLLTRHADVEMVLRDPRFAAQRTGGWVKDREDTAGELSGFQQLLARALLFLDAPDHPRIRKVLHAGFRSEVLQRLVPHIEQAVTELLDQGEGADCFDFIETVARPLPVRVITRLLGIENLQYDDFMAWSEDLASFIGALQPTRGAGATGPDQPAGHEPLLRNPAGTKTPDARRRSDQPPGAGRGQGRDPGRRRAARTVRHAAVCGL